MRTYLLFYPCAMTWIWLALGSAVFLGLYDIAKKTSIDTNAVWPVLFLCTLFGAILCVPTLGICFAAPDWARAHHIWVTPLQGIDHLRLILKATIVSLSWAMTYQAIKHLPLTVASPLRASAPLMTLLAAILFFSERPTMLQWLGIALTLGSYWVFALSGKKEGIKFHKNKWIGMMIIGTLLGAISSLYDKYLMQQIGLAAWTVQVWFSVYMLVIQGAWLLWFWAPKAKRITPFSWRWSIPMVGIFLVIADQFYFRALGQHSALVSMVSIIRRSNVVISFALGILVLKEHGRKGKVLAVLGILAGLVCMSL